MAFKTAIRTGQQGSAGENGFRRGIVVKFAPVMNPRDHKVLNEGEFIEGFLVFYGQVNDNLMAKLYNAEMDEYYTIFPTQKILIEQLEYVWNQAPKSLVRITYNGRKKGKTGRFYKDFTVQFDDELRLDEENGGKET